MKYRSRTDIVSQILQTGNGGTTKTRIMYSAYLSYAQLKEYLSMLTENGLIEHSKPENKYRTTAKGLQFLEAYGKLNDLTVGPLVAQKD
ncbi:MAG: winged helix-turn-helix domain-containing protein [Nitrososphaera sp.]|jgi:predicted transcriptional regulator